MMPATIRNVSDVASPLGMTRESQRTGEESTRASSKPPTRVESTLGTYQATRPARTSVARIKAVRVRLEIQIGVGSAVTSGSGAAPDSPPECPRSLIHWTTRVRNRFMDPSLRRASSDHPTVTHGMPSARIGCVRVSTRESSPLMYPPFAAGLRTPLGRRQPQRPNDPRGIARRKRPHDPLGYQPKSRPLIAERCRRWSPGEAL